MKPADGPVPRLRFPEFRDAGPWEVKRLGELGELIPGLTYDPADVRDDGLLVLRSSNIRDGQIDLNDRVYVDVEVSGATLLQKDDILICVRNGSRDLIGKNALLPEGLPRCTHGAFMSAFRGNESRFVFYLFQTQQYLHQVSTDLGATINSINAGNLVRYRFSVPSQQAEQHKIADCLTSLDELIRAEGEVLAALRDHKRGLMQRLFPRPGETTPRLRFPEFRDAGPWEVKRLGEVGTILKGKGISKSDIKPDGLLPCIRYGELYTIYGEVIRDVVSFTDADPDDLVLSNAGDVIIPASGETKEDIATASCVAEAGIALGGDLNILRSQTEGRFLAYYIRGNLRLQTH